MRTTALVVLGSAFATAAVGGLLVATSCARTPVQDLPSDDARVRVVGSPAEVAPPAPPVAAPSPPAAGDPAAAEDAPAAFEPLELDGVRGGRLEWDTPGTPAEVAEMLLDQDHATGHRAWAQGYRVLEREEGRVVAEWRFRGRMGIHPTVHVEHVVETEGDAVRVRFRLVRSAFGIASFFGDHRIAPRAGGGGGSRVTSRVFLDSGLSFANASHEDLEAGLRSDAEKMAAWMEERLAAGR